MIVGSGRMNEVIWREYRNEKKRGWGMPIFKRQVLQEKKGRRLGREREEHKHQREKSRKGA